MANSAKHMVRPEIKWIKKWICSVRGALKRILHAHRGFFWEQAAYAILIWVQHRHKQINARTHTHPLYTGNAHDSVSGFGCPLRATCAATHSGAHRCVSWTGSRAADVKLTSRSCWKMVSKLAADRQRREALLDFSVATMMVNWDHVRTYCKTANML